MPDNQFVETKSQVEDLAEFENEDGAFVRRWMSEIKVYQDSYEQWYQRTKKIIDRFRDERDVSHESVAAQTSRYNILWSNQQVLRPALYMRTPKPQVSRRFIDKDPKARLAAQVLERAITHCVESYDFDAVVRQVRDDYLLTGRGTAWVRYIPHFAPVIDPESGEETAEREVVYEETRCDFVNHSDFLHEPAPYWAAVNWVGRKVRMTRDMLIERFGEKVGSEIPLKEKTHHAEDKDQESGDSLFRRALIYEIWDKVAGQVIWICPDWDEPLDVLDDPLGLQGFFPCPRPMYGTLTTESLIPVPDYAMYQDQADQMDVLTERIHNLLDAIRVVGVGNGAVKELNRLFGESTDNEIILADNWIEFMESGGLQSNVQFLPIGDITNALQITVQAREQLKQDMYEVTGMSDIVRGATDARETASAQQLKGNFASIRLQEKQDEVARFAKDLLRIKAEIISEHFDQETLRLMSGFDYMTEIAEPDVQAAEQVQAQDALQAQALGAEGAGQQLAQVERQQHQSPEEKLAEAVKILRDDRMRTFRLEIETDSTVALDRQREKQNRIEFLSAVGGFLDNAVTAGQQYPEMGPLLGEMMMFGIRGFDAGRELEAKFEDTLAQLASTPSVPEPTNPALDENTQLTQALQQEVQLKAQIDQLKLQSDQQLAQAKLQQQGQIEQMRLASQQQIEAAKLEQIRVEAEERRTRDTELAALKLALDEQRLNMEAILKVLQIDAEADVKRRGQDLRHSAKREELATEQDISERGQNIEAQTGIAVNKERVGIG